MKPWIRKLMAACLLVISGCVTQQSPVVAPVAPPMPAPLVAIAKPLVVRPLAVQAPPAPGTISLAWDPSATSTVIGYKLYQGIAPGVYTNSVDTGSQIGATVPLVKGMTNYFAATAYTAAPLESDFSTEISVVSAPSPVAYLQAYIQTNSTLNTNSWGNLVKLPVFAVTNPPPLQFYRVDLFIDTTPPQ